jgi:hypothetical protein
MGASEAGSADSLSGAVLSPCSETSSSAGGSRAGAQDRSERLDESPVYLGPIRKELRALLQDITPLIGFLAEMGDSRSLHEWAWYFDELGEKAETVQSHAMLLKHMCDVMWERVYHVGREEG